MRQPAGPELRHFPFGRGGDGGAVFLVQNPGENRVGWTMMLRSKIGPLLAPARARTINCLYRLTPPMLWEAMLRLAGHVVYPDAPYRTLMHSGIATRANTRPLHVGRFAELYERHGRLDPYVPINSIRYRLYNVCMVAHLCRSVPGDFIFAGVSFGVAPRLIYDFVDLPALDKSLHLIDTFEGVGTITGGSKDTRSYYNTDIDYVRAQYPDHASVQFHRKLIPDALPLRGVERVAFVSMNTGDAAANAASLPILWEALSPGGAIMTDQYARGIQHFDPYIEQLGIEPFWFATGQGAFFKS